MRVIIDRFEGEDAVVEMPDLSFLRIPVKLLENAKEGDVVSICIDEEETKQRRKRIKELMDDLFEG